MKINKKSFSEHACNNSSSTKKNGCGCVNKDCANEDKEEIDVKIEK